MGAMEISGSTAAQWLHEMAVMGEDGHTRILWDPDAPAEVEVARDAFNKLIGKGYTAYSVTSNGEQGEKVRDFDPNLEALIMVPRIVGG